MLVPSTSVSPAHSVIIYRTKSILGFRAAVRSIYTVWHKFYKGWCKINQWQWFFVWFGSRVEFFLWTCTKGSSLFTTMCKIFWIKVLNLKFLCLKYLFCMEAIHFQNWCMIDLPNQYEVLLPLKTMQQQQIACFTHVRHTGAMTQPNLGWLKLSKVYDMGH